jgi:hypothetical protein
MTTALAVQNGDTRELEALLTADPTGGRLIQWAKAASAAHQLAKVLIGTGFVPKAFKTVQYDDDTFSPDDATAAILMGDEVGLSPLAALRSIYVIHGTPALSARTMRALALSHGHEMWTKERSAEKVVVCGRRRGTAHVETSEWTMGRARLAGYTSNTKYRTNPIEMLQAKADAEVARLIDADGLAGIPYSIEELEMEAELEAAAAPATDSNPGGTRTVTRRAKAAAIQPAEPDVDATPPAPPARTVPPRRTPEVHAPPIAPTATADPAYAVSVQDNDGEGDVSDDDPIIDAVTEAEDTDGEGYSDGPPAPDPTPALPPGLPADTSDAPANSVDPDVKKINPPQMKKMQVLFSKRNIKDRDHKLAYCEWVLNPAGSEGIEVTTSTELTIGQASQIIDALDKGLMPPDRNAGQQAAQDGEVDGQGTLL